MKPLDERLYLMNTLEVTFIIHSLFFGFAHKMLISNEDEDDGFPIHKT